MKVYYSLYDRLLSRDALNNAFAKVFKAKGKSGIDRIEVKDFENDQSIHITDLLSELKDQTYRPAPVLRVEIPKEGGGIRKLGIPTV